MKLVPWQCTLAVRTFPKALSYWVGDRCSCTSWPMVGKCDSARDAFLLEGLNRSTEAQCVTFRAPGMCHKLAETVVTSISIFWMFTTCLALH